MPGVETGAHAKSGGPGVLIAATHSGGGKTTVTTIVASALSRRGLDVQPFKVGPDFIDPAYHADATGRTSINLDIWMMGEQGVRDSYARWSAGADISVIESMGALYDGTDGTEHGSAAHVAKLLGLPILVVLDALGMTRTAAAILEGLVSFDSEIDIAGVVLNRVGSARHAEMVMEGLPEHLRRLVLGAIPRDRELEVAERHLGLLTVKENETAPSAREGARARAGQFLDIDRIGRIAGVGQATRPAPRTDAGSRPALARLAVARDRAFCFYYEENLLTLKDAGFELVPFGPTTDPQLPEDVDAVYIGGGYPESFAAELEENHLLAAELRERTRAGMPIYAECGGLLYLGRSLTGFDGSRHSMSGVLPLDFVMDRDYLAIRYVTARTLSDSPLGKSGTVARGQEFHQSRVVEAGIDPTLFELTTSEGQTHHHGYLDCGVLASYVHLHFSSSPDLARSLLDSAIAAR
jgi:cobyrinic acid a,c-diamide synthase